MLSQDQLEYLLSQAKKGFKSIFGSEPTEKEIKTVLEKELERRKLAVLTNRLCSQRADRDIVVLLDMVTPKAASSSAKAKPKKAVAPKPAESAFKPDLMAGESKS